MSTNRCVLDHPGEVTVANHRHCPLCGASMSAEAYTRALAVGAFGWPKRPLTIISEGAADVSEGATSSRWIERPTGRSRGDDVG